MVKASALCLVNARFHSQPKDGLVDLKPLVSFSFPADIYWNITSDLVVSAPSVSFPVKL